MLLNIELDDPYTSILPSAEGLLPSVMKIIREIRIFHILIPDF
jgi:hypothetical protein